MFIMSYYIFKILSVQVIKINFILENSHCEVLVGILRYRNVIMGVYIALK